MIQRSPVWRITVGYENVWVLTANVSAKCEVPFLKVKLVSSRLVLKNRGNLYLSSLLCNFSPENVFYLQHLLAYKPTWSKIKKIVVSKELLPGTIAPDK